MKLNRIFEKVLRRTYFKEQLIPAKMDELQSEMAINKKLQVFLTTPANKLPDEHRLLVAEITKEDEEKTLLDVITVSLTWRFYGTETICLFSKTGGNLCGFIAYIIKNDEIINMKMFPLVPKLSNAASLRYLRKLLKNLTLQYRKISWYARADDKKANKIYKIANKEFNGKQPKEIIEKNENGDEIKILNYCIENLYVRA